MTSQDDLQAKEDERDALQEKIDNFELDESEYEDSYDEMLDCDGPVYVAGMAFTASRILQELDPIAYSCGLTDYVDSLDKEENDDYKELLEELESLESQIITLEEDIDEIENELELEADEL